MDALARCPRCSGQLYREQVRDLGVVTGYELCCLQCGYRRELGARTVLPGGRKAPRLRRVRG